VNRHYGPNAGAARRVIRRQRLFLSMYRDNIMAGSETRMPYFASWLEFLMIW
jgi:hypothetical protein